MKAVTYRRYGSPDELRLEDIAMPAPADNQLLINIHAVSLNGSDREGLRGRPLYVRLDGLLKPRHPILGSDIAGRVERVGSNNTEFQPGDAVFGELPGYRGGFAEYVCTHGKTLALKPAGLSFAEAAAIPQGGVIALNGIRKKGQVQPGQRVLINGAGGSAGSFAVQLAKLDGADVTAVDHSSKLEFLRSLGADHVVDYTREDWTAQASRYDLILDLTATRSIFAVQRALKPGGTYLFVGGSVAVMLQILLLGWSIRRRSGRTIRILAVPQNRDDLLAITNLCVGGAIKPMIDQRHGLSEVPAAMRDLAAGRACGKLVIVVDPSHGT